ncbi:hypothetical protein H696_06388, partial [Fonticula alba]
EDHAGGAPAGGRQRLQPSHGRGPEHATWSDRRPGPGPHPRLPLHRSPRVPARQRRPI